jgi:hypothetical protein
MNTARTGAGLVIALVCLFAVGCDTAKDAGKTLGNLAVVRAEIIKKCGENGVDIRANTTGSYKTISVTFVNSPLNERGIADRAKRAQETAEIVKTHYPDIKSVKQILVSFMRSQTKYLVFHWNVVLDFHGFDNDAKVLPEFGQRYTSGNEDPSSPSTIYLPNRDQTDIVSNGFQLDGTPQKGLTLVPHFSVKGNINRVTPKPPTEVSLDFASFSDKQRFPDITKIVFSTDDKLAYETDAQFSTSRLADGSVNEFLYLKVPPSTFVKIADGDKVSVKLAKKEFLLTEQQLLMLKRMADFIKE